MTTNPERNADGLVAASQRILANRFGPQLHLEPEQPIDSSPRSKVTRMRVIGGPADAPATVIVKQAVVANDDEAYNPSATGFSPAWRFFNEWAGLQFLNQVFPDEAPVPGIYGGDHNLGILVMEDLGGRDSLTKPLLGNNPVAAEAALIAHMAMLGQLHARTVGKQAIYNHIRHALGSNPPYFSPAAESFFRPQQFFDVFHSTLAQLQLEPERGVDADLAAVAAFWDHQGRFLAYTHGDPAPGNEFQVETQRKLIDFEFGGFRHALTEGVYARMQFVTGWCVARLPDTVALQMEAAYRNELVKGCPEASDDTLFYQAMAEACGYATLAMWHWAFPGVLASDEAWGLSSYRQRILRRLDILTETTVAFGHLEALGATASRIAAKLRSIWPPEADSMPYYPAFRGDKP